MAVSALRTKPRPSNADVMEAVFELHDCLHAVDKKVDDIVEVVGHVKERVAKVEGYNEGLAAKFKLPVDGQPVGFWRRHKNPVLLLGAALGFVGSLVAAYPFLRVLAVAGDAYLVKAGAK